MYRKILVALDHSEASDYVFRQALDLARAAQAKMLLVHGLSSDEEGSPMPLPPETEGTYWMPGVGGDETNFDIWRDSWERYETEGLDRLRRFAATANEQNVSTEFRQVVGNPGKVICNLARQWEANLIVIGNRGRSGLAEFMLGSVSSYVMHRAPCSVLVLKDHVLANKPIPEQTATV